MYLRSLHLANQDFGWTAAVHIHNRKLSDTVSVFRCWNVSSTPAAVFGRGHLFMCCWERTEPVCISLSACLRYLWGQRNKTCDLLSTSSLLQLLCICTTCWSKTCGTLISWDPAIHFCFYFFHLGLYFGTTFYESFTKFNYFITV